MLITADAQQPAPTLKALSIVAATRDTHCHRTNWIASVSVDSIVVFFVCLFVWQKTTNERIVDQLMALHYIDGHLCNTNVVGLISSIQGAISNLS